jgi:hypothetical protein
MDSRIKIINEILGFKNQDRETQNRQMIFALWRRMQAAAEQKDAAA